MTGQFVFSIAILLLATTGAAQDSLTLPANSKPAELTEEAREICFAACTAMHQEFGCTRPLHPKATLTLGAGENGQWRDTREIRLGHWDRYLLAQGVVILAFGELMPAEQKLTMAGGPPAGRTQPSTFARCTNR